MITFENMIIFIYIDSDDYGSVNVLPVKPSSWRAAKKKKSDTRKLSKNC